MAPALTVLVVSALLPGCATPQMQQVHANMHASSLPVTLPVQAGVASVPFFAQKEHECAPASLAMVFSAAGIAVTPQALLEQVYLPARKGSLQVEVLAATRRQALLALTLPPSMSALLQEVTAGHPVLVLQNLSLPVYPVWHYAVVVGYDLERNTLTLHSGETERLESCPQVIAPRS
ncbi:MAG: PA2778 family cysteine peptidase [Rhodoferax sp.]|nr:PA2778 family cysteine peptidase [Rhodoferax sp.]